MLDEPLWYWLIFLAALIFVVGMPIAYWWEDRQERRDKEEWNRYMQRRAR